MISERYDAIIGVMTDIGKSSPANSGHVAPMPDDVFGGHAKIGIIGRDVAAPTEPDTGNALQRILHCNMMHGSINFIKMFRYFF